MAETLGSLVDKLTIKSLREFHIGEMLKKKKAKFPAKELKKKLGTLKVQKEALFVEIDEMISSALAAGSVSRDEKLKLYNNPGIIGKVGKVTTIAKAIEGLAQKNIALWALEDEARREDVSLDYIGQIKKKIDVTNQHRNDFIDKIDELFEQAVFTTLSRRKKSR